VAGVLGQAAAAATLGPELGRAVGRQVQAQLQESGRKEVDALAQAQADAVGDAAEVAAVELVGEAEPPEQFEVPPRTEYYVHRPVRWDSLSLSSRTALYRKHGHPGHEGAMVAQQLTLPPLVDAAPAPPPEPHGMEPSLPSEPWTMRPQVRRMTDALLDQEYSDPPAETEFAKQFIKQEIAQLDREAVERRRRAHEARLYSPGYYGKLLSGAIHDILVPPNLGGYGTPQRARTGLNWGPEQYRRSVRDKIAYHQAQKGLTPRVAAAQAEGNGGARTPRQVTTPRHVGGRVVKPAKMVTPTTKATPKRTAKPPVSCSSFSYRYIRVY